MRMIIEKRVVESIFYLFTLQIYVSFFTKRNGIITLDITK